MIYKRPYPMNPKIHCEMVILGIIKTQMMTSDVKLL